MIGDDLAGLTAALLRMEAALEASHEAARAAIAVCRREIERLRAPDADTRVMPPQAALQRLADFVYATAQTPGEQFAAKVVGEVEQAVAQALAGWVVRWRDPDSGYCIREFLAETLQAAAPVKAGATALAKWALLWPEADAQDAVAAALRAACASLPSC